MNNIVILQMPFFKRSYKKLHAKERLYVDKAIQVLTKEPTLGELKKGDLAAVFVYKFKIYNQLMLLAYEYSMETLTLLAIGPHENFYRDLKNNKFSRQKVEIQ